MVIAESERINYIDAPSKIKEAIINSGEISPDGAILRLKALNRNVDMGLIRDIADYMVVKIKESLGIIDPQNTIVCVVESSGNMLAGFVGERLGLNVVIIKKGQPKTVFGKTLTRNIHSFTRGVPTTICVEAEDIKGKNIILVDDFAATGETLKAVKEMAEEVGASISFIAVAVSKPKQGSEKILKGIPSLSVVTIEEMEQEKDSQPAKIKFQGENWRELKSRWGDENK